MFWSRLAFGCLRPRRPPLKHRNKKIIGIAVARTARTRFLLLLMVWSSASCLICCCSCLMFCCWSSSGLSSTCSSCLTFRCVMSCCMSCQSYQDKPIYMAPSTMAQTPSQAMSPSCKLAEKPSAMNKPPNEPQMTMDSISDHKARQHRFDLQTAAKGSDWEKNISK